MPVALTRAVSPRISECELTYLDRDPIDYARAAAQHDEYERLLARLGCEIVHVDPAPDNPDGVFVEDTAIVLDDVAIITRPGAESRRGETESVARVLSRYRELRYIAAPGTIDGGDVLRVGETLYVGRSRRTNDAAISQLPNAIPVDFRGCLHLKSAVTLIDEKTLLFNPDFVDPFPGFEMIETDEPNALRVGDTIIVPAEHTRTRSALERRYRVAAPAMSELLKAEAGVTCCSIIVGLHAT